jgi:hypothetical protein
VAGLTVEFFYPVLQQGDQLPAVAVLQKLLCRAGAKLAVDGTFGPRTRAAVLEFQQSRRVQSVMGPGITDQSTWAQLTLPSELPIVDAVDVFDPNVYRQDALQIKQEGGAPILIGGMSNGVVQAVTMVRREARRLGDNVFLLRLNGHGSPGKQYMSAGGGSWREWQHGKTVLQAEELMALDRRIGFDDLYGRKASVVANGTTWRMRHHKMPTMVGSDRRPTTDQVGIIGSVTAQVIGKQTDLWASFGPYGCVQLHGCNVGAGAKGRKFLHDLAEALRVPASAAGASGEKGKQLMGRHLQFFGPVYTAFPNGDAKRWYNSLPDFPPMSVGD